MLLNNRFLSFQFRPDHLKENFIVPGFSLHDIQSKAVVWDTVIRFAASYDMGWITRGTGMNYDSLTGYGTLIGFFSKKIIAYTTMNRKCKMCDYGHSPDDHDCRKNFEGSAKAMEPAAAINLILENPVLQDCFIQLGILVSDNDSSTIAALRERCDHEIVKLSDKNHTRKGLSNQLFELKRAKRYKELSVDSIKYLSKCFGYCIAQNAFNPDNMEKAVKNIPEHAFNNHTDCGDWCGYVKDPENYKHKVIDEGFQDPRLYDDIKIIFDNLAEKKDSYVAGASSNINESFNASMVSKAPKRTLYGTSISGSGRAALTVGSKNEKSQYYVDLNEGLNISPGKYTVHHNEKKFRKSEKRYQQSLTKDFKLNRIHLTQKKKQLRLKKSLTEPISYESNIGLLSDVDNVIDIASIDESLNFIIVFFDLETSGRSRNKCEILQIAALYGEHLFSVYVRPTRKIEEGASLVNGIRYEEGILTYNFKEIDKENVCTLSEALKKFYIFLSSFGRKVILTAHNCAFDRPILIRSIQQTYMLKHFKSVTHGFTDTLPLTRLLTGKKGKGENTLTSLAANFAIDTSNAHNAVQDVEMLQQVVIKLGITNDDLQSSAKTLEDVLQVMNDAQELSKVSKDLNLNKLIRCTSKAMRDKMARSKISYNMILDACKQKKFQTLRNLLGKDESGSVRVTTVKNVATKIFDYLQKNIIQPNIGAVRELKKSAKQLKF